MKSIYRQIAKLGQKYHADKIVLFGSRARGDHRERSDIDLAVYGMPEGSRALFWSALDDLPTLIDFDIVHITEATDPKLLQNIEKDGVVLMNKLQEKYGKLTQALTRLKEAIADYENTKLDSVRDGVIQRFEFCTELTWKTLRKNLLDQGYTEINSPKSVMRQAYADGLIGDEQSWIGLLNDRNLTSHLYDEDTAVQIYNRISGIYVKMFDQICSVLSGK